MQNAENIGQSNSPAQFNKKYKRWISLKVACTYVTINDYYSKENNLHKVSSCDSVRIKCTTNEFSKVWKGWSVSKGLAMKSGRHSFYLFLNLEALSIHSLIKGKVHLVMSKCLVFMIDFQVREWDWVLGRLNLVVSHATSI